MTQYLLSGHSVAGQPARSPEDTRKAYADTAAFNAGPQAGGFLGFGGGLQPAATAKVVRVRDSEDSAEFCDIWQSRASARPDRPVHGCGSPW